MPMADALVPRPNKTTIPIRAVAKRNLAPWLKKQAAATRTWLQSQDFQAKSGQVVLVPGKGGAIGQVVLGLGDDPDPWTFAGLDGKLPKGRYAFDELDAALGEAAALGFALAQYRFERYRQHERPKAQLVWPRGVDQAKVTRLVEAITLGRDLINTPAQDMGPAELAQAAEQLGARHKAKVETIIGEGLLERNYPAIHAVGRASHRPPRLIDLTWGRRTAPKVTLVGKGVCFDTGGLDLKTADGMKLMKKDMGGAAAVLGLAHALMDHGLDIRLRVLIPAVENAVAGNAYRPGDVLQTRKGLTVEIGNTDAEGRVILCDALTEADREDPDLLIDMATLTGAARVALGTELPAFFCDDDAWTEAALRAGKRVHDPMWRMPLFTGYRRQLDSHIANLNNIGNSGYGGAITAALYLREFVSRDRVWTHIDTMAWNLSSRPGRPAGGELFGVRALYEAIVERYEAQR